VVLFRPYPDQVPPDPARRRTLGFSSPADGRPQQVDVYSPANPGDESLPLVVALHGAGWTASQDYHWGLPGLKVGYHRGWYGLADRYRVIIAMPHGHHRREETMSFASPEQIADIVQLPALLESHHYPVDRRQVYASGLSMGGQEVLVAGGRYPEHFAAVVAFNPVADLAALQQDMVEVDAIRGSDAAARIAHEVGGEPDDVHEAYAERSPLSYLDGLTRLPALLLWSDKDFIVPHQLTRQTYRLYQQVKARSPTSPIAEYNHTLSHGVTEFSQEVCWQLHEWSDYELGLRWLLIHERGKETIRRS
jgi:acetyl esterase/lipase